YLLADELGLDLMLNEHHQTATCMNATSIVSLSVLARQSKRARLLILGYPIGHRPDPLRAAEELSTIDVTSRGRLDMGFVNGVPSGFRPLQPHPGRCEGSFRGAPRFHRQGDPPPRGAFNRGERALPFPAGQRRPAARAAPPPAGVEHDRIEIER